LTQTAVADSTQHYSTQQLINNLPGKTQLELNKQLSKRSTFSERVKVLAELTQQKELS